MRKITLRGDNARYTERRNGAMTDDNREILLEGTNVHYTEQWAPQAPHFPLLEGQEQQGRDLYTLLVEKQFIAGDTDVDCWLYTMGYTAAEPAEVRPIEWLKNVQLAQVMLRGVFSHQIEQRQLSVDALMALAEKCFTKDGKPLHLSKFRAEISTDNDLLQAFFRQAQLP